MSPPLVADAREHGLAGDGVTNDQPALAALVEELGRACARDGHGRVISCPPGVYAIRDKGIVWRSGVSLIGAGPGATKFVLSNPGAPDTPVQLAIFTAEEHDASRDNHVADVAICGLEIDGSGVLLPEYHVLAKGLGLQYVVRGRFRDLYIHDTGATGFGCDFLQDTIVDNVVAHRCGRLDDGDQMGGAGIGIGIGGWGPSERLTVSGCTAVGNATNGIFLELQKDHWPPPRAIRIVGCHAEDNRFGISDWGSEGLVVSGCTMIGNHEAGFDVSSQGTTEVGGRGGILTGCIIDLNVRDGVSIGNTPGPYAIAGCRISNNGRFGFREHDLEGGVAQAAAHDVVVENSDIYGNGLDGVHVDAGVDDAFLVDNRIRNNGVRCAPAAIGGGAAVRYEAMCVVDESAGWPASGHRGKRVEAAGRTAMVLGNTATRLLLAPCRPGATTAWDGAVPPDGADYRLPDPPAERAGIAVHAIIRHATIRGNRVWDTQERPTQTRALWVGEDGELVSPRGLEDNDFG